MEPKAVFLSYASQDAEAARRICEALRAAGVEVWFDQSELRGGDAWDASIRAKIKDCALFVPIVSRNTDARGEGYFRLEWKLGVARSQLMADDEPFLVPVVVDGTSESAARVPEAFLDRQWTRLEGGNGAGAFAERVKGLLQPRPEGAAAAPLERRGDRGRRERPARRIPMGLVYAALGMAFAAYIATHRPPKEGAKQRDEPPAVATSPAPAASAAPSIAVLPFANLSEDKGNEYFSDGVAEELLTVLQKIPGLQVVGRSSSFAFKGASATAQEIGRKLGVAHLVEGSVRKSGKSVRIAARLVRTGTGEQLWSDAYTRDLDDVFAVQSSLAQTIVEQLRGHLGGASIPAKAEVQQIAETVKGGTQNADAHQLYLQGIYYLHQFSLPTARTARGFLERAVAIDPGFALAWAALSRAGSQLGGYAAQKREFDAGWALARRAGEKALALEPDLPDSNLARANMQIWHDYDWKGATESIGRARRAAPNDPNVAYYAAMLAYSLGRIPESVERAREAVARDPLNAETRSMLGFALDGAGRFAEAEEHFTRVAEFNPAAPWGHAGVGLTLMRRGLHEEAVREAQKETTDWSRLTVQSMAWWGWGKRAESDAALAQLKKGFAEVAALQVAQVHAYRGEGDAAFEWLERALRQRDSGLAWTRSELAFKRLHGDARWPAFLRKLGLSDEQLR